MLVVLAGGIYLLTKIEREFTPPTPARRMSIAVTAENGVTFEETRQVFDAFERDLLARTEELEIDAVSANFSARSGNVTVYFRDDASTQRSTAELTNEIRAMMPQLPGYDFSVGRRWGRGGGGALGVSVDITGPNTEVLALFAEDIGARLGALPGVDDVSTNLESGDEQLQVRVNPRPRHRRQPDADGGGPTAELQPEREQRRHPGGRRRRVADPGARDRGGAGRPERPCAAPRGSDRRSGSARCAGHLRAPAGAALHPARRRQRDRLGYRQHRPARHVRLRGQIQGMLAGQQLPPGYTAEVGQELSSLPAVGAAVAARTHSGRRLHLPRDGGAVRVVRAPDHDTHLAAVLAARRRGAVLPHGHHPEHQLVARDHGAGGSW